MLQSSLAGREAASAMSVPDTTIWRGPAAKRGPVATHCSVGLDLAEGSAFASELTELLHGRLRVVVLIALMPTALFLVRNLLEAHHRHLLGPVGLALHAMLTALLAWMAALLWVRPAVSLCSLRKLELALFGSLATFFGWLQVCTFRHDPLFQAAGMVLDLEMVRVWIDSTAVRWFFLIVCYGVFIPNTWKRCAVVAGVGALLPLLLTPLGAWRFGRLEPDVLLGTLDLLILMGTAVAVAVFGSHRFEVLRRAAFQAKQLGRYRLKQKLGAGGMGEVHLAEHELLRRPCAIKLIRPDQQGDPTAMRRFEREVQAMATLTHPNTVEVFDYGRSDDGTFYYVMEFLPGLNLETLVSRYGPVPAGRAVHFLRQVCRALREAHEIGLLHRDIKPSNIIACERGGVYDVAKLLDFGLVQGQVLKGDGDRVTIQGTILGSPAYLSPEQAAGKTDVDARADIYSLGGVGYYLLTGQPPFVRETAMELLLAHAYEPVLPPGKWQPDVPADVEAVILRCLSKKPEDRFADVTILEQALAACGVAGAWDEEQARQWWKSRRVEQETSQAIPAMATPTGR
jgi:serine/threonine-protein kinase